MEDDNGFEQIWSIYPHGDKTEAINVYTVNISSNKVDVDGNAVTPEFLYDKYKAYNEWWNFTFGKRDKKYVASKDDKETVWQFLMKETWNKSFCIETNTKRDAYLFGEYANNIPALQAKLDDFKRKNYGTEPEQKKKYKQGTKGEPF